MKHLKKFLSVLLALGMLLALAVPAFADNTYKVTISGTTSGHIYEAYQVFKGDLADVNSAKVLSNVEWGSGVDGTALLSAITGDTKLGADFTSVASAADVAAALAKTGNDSEVAQEFADLVSAHLSATIAGSVVSASDSAEISGLSAGYYLIKDQNGSQTDENAVYTRFILEVVGDAAATVKQDVPSVTKKVKENVKAGAAYNDVADYNINDHVPFMLTGTLPSNYDAYESYNYIFHDTLSAGLTYDTNSVKVLVNGNGADITGAFSVNITGNALTLTCANLKEISGVTLTVSDTIVVTYTATLNDSAVVGLPGNPNEVYLEYSNNPNAGGTGNTGKTPTDKVIVFTYELDSTKVDGANTSTTLPDAEFTLQNAQGKYVTVGANGVVTGWADKAAAESTLKSGADGKFIVKGLDDGVYTLTETKAPAGYNLLKDSIQLTITATTVNGDAWDGMPDSALTKLTLKVGDGTATDGDANHGVVKTEIANNSGNVLPSTGGIGTTIFTVGGIVLMAGAAILLIARRKVHGEEK